jgi:BirA family biotin operon repressor/biotin-[acetyl-CoA-carboxylase] ligase
MSLSWLKNYNLLIFDQIDSTNNEALRLAKTNIVGNFVIIARTQTAGKGQKSRSWASVSGNLHASILLQTDLPANRLKELSFLTAVALHKTITAYINKLKISNIDIKLKWPNDILIEGKKLAGILLESTRFNNKNYVIIGVGVNTHFLPEIKNVPVTSLLNEGIVIRHSDDFLSAFMLKFETYYNKWLVENSFASIKKEWLKNAYYLNKNVTLNDGIQKISGIFKGIDEDGGICIKIEKNGQIHSFSSGDITYD